jgi:GAF domain-containing protein
MMTAATTHGLIAAHGKQIAVLWSHEARQVPSARGLSERELIGTMMAYLESLGHDDAEEPARLRRGQLGLIERHLSSRMRQGFVLNEILTEFAILGRCITAVLPATGSARLLAELYAGTIAATSIFNEHMLEDEQTNKHYGRLLQEIANLEGERALTLREILDELLGVIAQAMGAETAALLLSEAGSDRLILAASNGFADGELDDHVAALDPEAEATTLQVGDSLRARGIGSLLGIRMSSRDRLLGVLFIGIREGRPFTASEIRRVEGLSRALTMHLDGSRPLLTLTR